MVMENVKDNSKNMNIFIEVIQDSNFLKSMGAGVLCFFANIFAFDAHLIISALTYLMSFCAAFMALYNSYLSIQIRKTQLQKEQKKARKNEE